MCDVAFAIRRASPRRFLPSSVRKYYNELFRCFTQALSSTPEAGSGWKIIGATRSMDLQGSQGVKRLPGFLSYSIFQTASQKSNLFLWGWSAIIPWGAKPPWGQGLVPWVQRHKKGTTPKHRANYLVPLPPLRGPFRGTIQTVLHGYKKAQGRAKCHTTIYVYSTS